MATSSGKSAKADRNLPFTAPSKTLDRSAPIRWLRLGWRDLRQAPKQSLSYGLIMVALSYAISGLFWKFGNLGLYLGLLSGFVFVAPVLAIGLYSISYQLKEGRKPILGYCLREGWRNLGSELIFAVMLLIVFLIWARAASLVYIFFPVEGQANWQDTLQFFAIGISVGAVFTTIIFTASAFSLPMIMDCKVDAVTAVITSVNAVLKNKGVMLLWAAIIVTGIAIGFATAFLGLIVILPLLGHATWHSYQETIDAQAWPSNK